MFKVQGKESVTTKTVLVNVPDTVEAKLNFHASRNNVTKAELVRQMINYSLSNIEATGNAVNAPLRKKKVVRKRKK